MAVADLAFGFILIAVGVASLLLATVYWKVGGVTLLSFGVFSLLYSGRLLLSIDELMGLLNIPVLTLAYATEAINYWLPVPLLVFAEQQLGSGWKSSLRWLWQVWIACASGFLVYDLVVAPGASLQVWFIVLVVLSLLAATIVLHLLWRGPPRATSRRILAISLAIFVLLGVHDLVLVSGVVPWTVSLERYGLTAFVLSVGYVTARQVLSDQQVLAAMDYELHTAAAIQTAILPREVPLVSGLRIAVRHLPMGAVAGDLYDFAAPGERRIGILVADVTGHGIPAALIASMASVAFSSQAAHAGRPGQLLSGVNQALFGHLVGGQFVTAVYVHIDAGRDVLRYSSAGHPPALLWRSATQQVLELSEGGVFLGFDPSIEYPSVDVPIQRGDRLVLYTDGVTEAVNGADEPFGQHRLQEFITRNEELAADDFASGLLDRVRHWSGHSRFGRSFEDDLTLIVVDVIGSPAPDSPA